MFVANFKASLRCCTWRRVVDRLNGELPIIIAVFGVDVAKPRERVGRACRATVPDRAVRDDEAISGRSSAGDGLDIVIV